MVIKLKNRSKAYKYILKDITTIIISLAITLAILIYLYKIMNHLYITSRYPLLNTYIDIFMAIKYNILGDSVYLILTFILFLGIYSILNYRKYKKIALLVENVHAMAQGNLNQRIDINSRDEIGKVGGDINNIVSQLRKITIDERKAQQTKTDLITNVSHDLRTPLTSIIGYLNLIEEDKYKDEVELRYYINIAYEKAKNLNVLINDLFELTKMQNKTLPFDKIEINLVELISQITSHFEYQLRTENMEVRVEFLSEKLMVKVDPIKLVRAFENLITNAMKYGKDGYYIDIKVNTEGEFALVQFINYGESIPVVDIPYIFDRFYRVEKSRNRYDGGSGLGLAITKNIIESHNGTISVDSDDTKTIFEVRLPLKDK